jgi:hypothetical protein
MTTSEHTDTPRTMSGKRITINHSATYRCRHTNTEGVRTHDAYADVRPRIDGKQWPLCHKHAAEWRALGILASRPGPREANRRSAPQGDFHGWG